GLAALLFEVQTLVVRLVFQHQERRQSAADPELLTVGNYQAVELRIVEGQEGGDGVLPPAARCQLARRGDFNGIFFGELLSHVFAFDDERGLAGGSETARHDELPARIDRCFSTGNDDVACRRAAGEADLLDLEALMPVGDGGGSKVPLGEAVEGVAAAPG